VRIVVVALAIWMVAGCGGQSQQAQPTSASASAPGGRVAGTTLDGDTVSLDGLRGRPVLVNVWSSW